MYVCCLYVGIALSNEYSNQMGFGMFLFIDIITNHLMIKYICNKLINAN